MIENTYELKPGYILIDENENVLYTNSNYKYDINHLLKTIKVFERIRTGNFGVEMCDNFKVSIEPIHIENQKLYVVEFMDAAHTDSLSRIAYKDLMSGLYNRNMWEDMLENRFEEFCHQFNTLVIIDIDNLKEVNDTAGHAVGDRMIKIVADSIKESIRSKDFACRYGGDEFIILLNDLKNNNVNKFVNRIRRKISKNCKEDEIHVSIGVATFKNLSDLQAAFQKADHNLYEEKKGKKKQVVNEEYYKLLESRETIEDEGAQAEDLAAMKPSLLYQDILDLSKKLDSVLYRQMAFKTNLKPNYE
ncbi:GGDEF domain-containing protein [Geosporobacter ferrireducens]|uniref:GGDEF domain-containing protein n=1 Tax=Geosporobacter ferrireducens TaxID=1424294 RepID=A0A1D8GKW8_9FIRM|nr:GGDEF domain-containing protein [Geosporobacter ferrireducens]AOT71546.1 hypothetical protein Gferi_19615 [Geosporobacter ferrireducens]MTI57859.1 GGDEF domain-containing protein [Geosporobacter ferrireducens]